MNETKGKRILMVCYYYPPLTDVGCKRSVAFSKYWKEAGWEPHVLSVKNPDKAYCSIGNDTAPEGVDVTYVSSLFNLYKFFGKLNGLFSRLLKLVGIRHEKNYFYDLFCIPDIFIGWIPLAVLKGRKLVKENNIDVIYVSCSPFSSGIIGWWIKKLTGKPLVIDYRDPYGLDISKYQSEHKPIWFRRLVDRWIAGAMLNPCDLFTVTTEETKELYIEQFPFIKDKIHTIYNGFDHHLLEDLDNPERFNKFTIIYTGNFYYDVKFDYFFEGLGLLKREGKICMDNFQFLFYGGEVEPIWRELMQYNIEDLVHVRSRVPSKDLLLEMMKSHMQLLRITQPMITTKLFEGISLNLPFLATIPEGEVAGIVKYYSPHSYIITDNNSMNVKNCLLDAIKKYENKTITNNIVEDFLNIYSREHQSEKYIELMDAVLRIV